MIHNVSILQGYTALRGTSLIHFPMLIVHLVLIRVPSHGGDIENVFPEANIWYYYGAAMHFMLGAIHITGFCEMDSAKALYLDSVRIISVVLQVLNFILICQMWVFAPQTHQEMTWDQMKFDYWLFVEATLIFATVSANILFLFIRSLERNKLLLEIGSFHDEEADYISTIETQFNVNLFAIVLAPALIIAGTQYIYFPHRHTEMPLENHAAIHF